MSWSDEMNRIQEHPERHPLLSRRDSSRASFPYLKCLIVEHYIDENSPDVIGSDIERNA